jgi:hypothetical protein
MAGKRRPIYGVGINDADYIVCRRVTVEGKSIGDFCPYYKRWISMLVRCYSKTTQSNFPTYKGCSVCDEWLLFSNFRRWVDEQPRQDWQDLELDKDILDPTNKMYSPDKCVFVTRKVNSFTTSSFSARGSCLLGVNWHKSKKKYVASCNNPFTGKKLEVGLFNTDLAAHKAWQAKKHEYACQLAELQEDSRVADALRQRYAPDKDWTKR